MDFTRLRLIGFKSFVDPTDLLIEPGLTGIVGPNGCGKSNLTEALRWVMGETSAKSLRGSGMEDVIFAGTTRRPARAFAEVSLFIDNTDHTAPAQFNEADQLDIIRRISRGIGSAYKVNGKDHRARDVQTLFADAATGAHSPSLVRQGQIGELINAKPKNRRRILEDAAGIAGLYARRHEAELKLNATSENLSRLGETLAQLERQLKTLQHQSVQAARYRKLSESLRRHEMLVLYVTWTQADTQHREIMDRLHTAAEKVTRACAQAQEAQDAREILKNSLIPLREEEAIAAAVIQKGQLEQDRLKAEITQAKAVIETQRALVIQHKANLEREETLNADAKRMLTQLTAEDASIAQEQSSEQQEIDQAQTEITAQTTCVKAAETAFEAINIQFAKTLAQQEQLSGALKTQEKALETIRLDLMSTQASLDKLEHNKAALEESYQTLQSQVTQAQSDAQMAQEEITRTEAAHTSASAAEHAARNALAELEAEHKTLAAEEKSLQGLLHRAASKSHTASVLAEISVQAGYEVALGAVLGGVLDYPAVEDGVGWRTVIQGADDRVTHDRTFQDVTPLLDYVTAPAPLHRRLRHIGVLAEDAPTPAQWAGLSAGQVLVNRQGDVWRWDGLHLSAQETVSDASQQLAYKNRLIALQEALGDLFTRLTTSRTDHARTKAQAHAAHQVYHTARTTLKQADEALNQSTRALSKCEAERTAQEGQLESLRETLSKQETELGTLSERLTHTKVALQGLPDMDAQKADLVQAKDTLRAQQDELNTAKANLDTLHRRVHGRKKRRETIARECRSWQNRLDSAAERLADLEACLHTAQAELQTAQERPAALEAKAQDLCQQYDIAQERHAAAKQALTQAEEALVQAEKTERAAQTALTQAREVQIVLNTKAEAAAQKVTTTRAALEVHAPVDSLQVDDLPSRKELEASVQTLTRERETMGPVNLCADTEAQEVQEEFDKLQAEKQDLEAAVEKLRGAISRLNREGRQRLLKAFDEVNANFSMLFKHLFNGGEAHLTLIESDDPLEAGLEILCMPPGKKLASLSLLSGGEQTLTALSLIFAVFLTNPSPICVLDEVDAPLDDANVNRFCDLLEEMTRRTKTRFLIITHHATTMSRMDRLFGVTMQEHGVSQLVSVDLSTAAQMVP